MRRILIWIARLVGAVLALAILTGLGGWAWLTAGLPKIEGRLSAPGLERPVDIVRDGDGVPHIFAETLDDASFALGYAHAQDRLFQMDFQRRLAAGRLAEVLGPMALPNDRMMRTLGIYRLAEQTLEQLPPAMRKRVDAYSRGVNAYLSTRQGGLPIEYAALKLFKPLSDPDPEPWRGADSLVWGRLMALTLSGNARGEAIRARLAKRLTPAQMADLFAEERSGAVTLPDRPDDRRAEAAPAAEAPRLDRLFASFLTSWPTVLGPMTASNAWVVDGGRSASGKPILANDPHLGFTAPGLWYLARMTTPEGDLTGATVPGVPFPILGHNGRVAWGMTTTTADTQDLFIETLLDGDRHLTPDGPAPLTIREETIRVASGDPVTIKIRSTRHGPVISDVDPTMATIVETGSALALASTALRPNDRSLEAVWAVGGARNVGEVRAALAYADAPMQNVFFSDALGGAGVMAAAKVPIRRSGDGFMPANGATGTQDWTGWIPPEMLPAGAPSAGGFLANANNRVVGPGYPYFISRDWDPAYRGDRLTDLLSASTRDGVDGHLTIQRDIHSGMAERLLPILLPLIGRDSRAAPAAALLAAWDRRMDRERPEPLLFAAWLRLLGAALIAPAGDVAPMIGGSRARLIERAFLAENPWCASDGAEGAPKCRALAESTLVDAVNKLSISHGKEMTSWKWGAAHQARHAHLLFGRIPVLRDWFDIVIPTDGGDDTLNRGAMGRGGDDLADFDHIHGAGYRAVYDLADLPSSRVMIATGQSGNPLSPHYRDLTQRWRDGESVRVSGTRAELVAQNGKILTLSPP